MVQCVLFDFFGTLVDYTHGRTDQDFSATHQLMRANGIEIAIDEMVRQFDLIFQELETRSKQAGQEFSMHDAVGRFLEGVRLSPAPGFEDSLVETYLNDWAQHVVFLPGLDRYLQSLAREYRLGIITNTHHAPLIHDLMAQMNVDRCFEIVVTSVEHGRPKPHPAIFEHTLEALALTASDAVYVGDSFEADYQGARRAGLDCYLIGHHARVPVAHQIASVFDLPRQLGAAGHRR